MINRIRAIRKDQGLTLADLAAACSPPTTAQTIGRLETGTRTLSLSWMERIAAALGVEPQQLLRSEAREPVQIIAELGANGAHALTTPAEALGPAERGGEGLQVVMRIAASCGEYRAGDQLWLRQIPPDQLSTALNRDILAPRPGGRFAFGRLIDWEAGRLAILPPGAGEKQMIVEHPPWVALADMLVRVL